MSVLDDIPLDARVLVAVVTRLRDMAKVRDEGWYRVPLSRAPRALAAEYLAFYQTAAFGTERWAVRSIAAVRSVGLATRAALLPEEPNHPRAAERYYRFALGPLLALPVPVPSRRLRRVTFIPTTFGQLLRARDLTELWHPDEDQHAAWDGLWGGGVNQRRTPGENKEQRTKNKACPALRPFAAAQGRQAQEPQERRE